MGVSALRALLCGVCVRAPDFCKLSQKAHVRPRLKASEDPASTRGPYWAPRKI